MRRLPGPAVNRPGNGGNSRGSLRIVSGLAENTNSIFCDSSTELEAANGCPVLLGAGTTSREAHVRRTMTRSDRMRTPERAQEYHALFLTDDLHGWRFGVIPEVRPEPMALADRDPEIVFGRD